MIRRAEISNPNHLNIVSITGNYSCTGSEDVILANATAGAITITLPGVFGNKNVHLKIKKTDSSTNAITINPQEASGVTIDGNSSQTINSQYGTMSVISDGILWWIEDVSVSSGFDGGITNNPVIINSASPNPFIVGANGATNPAFEVDASTANAATGIKIRAAAAGAGVALSVITSGTNEGLKIVSAGNGFVSIQPGTDSTGFFVLRKADGVTNYLKTDTTNSRIAIGTFGSNAAGATLDVWSTSANAFSVGANGTTNPTFVVDASTGSVATGIKIKGNAAASGVAISAITSGTNENLTIDAAGSGTITINGTATGAVIIGSSLQVSLSAALLTGTTPAAGGTIAMRLGSSGGGGPQVVVGSGAPTIAASQGSIYLRIDGTTTNNRAYINTSGSTTWTALTTAA